MEGILPDAGELTIFSKVNTGQARAIFEGSFANAVNAVWNRDTGQAGANREGVIPDAGYTVRDYNTCKAGAIIEGIIPNTGDPVWDPDAGQS